MGALEEALVLEIGDVLVDGGERAEAEAGGDLLVGGGVAVLREVKLERKSMTSFCRRVIAMRPF